MASCCNVYHYHSRPSDSQSGGAQYLANQIPVKRAYNDPNAYTHDEITHCRNLHHDRGVYEIKGGYSQTKAIEPLTDEPQYKYDSDQLITYSADGGLSKPHSP
jgi:hypothetical protein